MVRDNRIKSHNFASQTFAAAGNLSPIYTDSLNGEILEVDWTTDNTGSVWLAISGTGEEFFRRNAPSGTGIQVTRPGVFTQDYKAGSIANANHAPYVVHAPIYVAGSGFGSGTLPLTVNVRYR